MPHQSPDPSLVLDASLHLLGDHLLRGLATGQLPPALVEVRDRAAGFELGLLPLDDAHPRAVLLGRTCSPDVHAVGVLTGGRARRLDLGESDQPWRVDVLAMVSRTGEHVHRVEARDPALAAQLEGERPEGELVDLLQRGLSMPTPPAPAPPLVLWAIEWLAALLHTETVPTLPHELMAIHPAAGRLRSTGDAAEPDIGDLAAAAARWDWARLRHAAAAGDVQVPQLHADDAGWLDDGAFARWWLSRLPGLGPLRRRVAARLPAASWSWLVGALDDLGIPSTNWPDRSGASTNHRRVGP